jgi:hypothetical protein
MTKLEVFDPPLCCSSGVCGPGVNPALPRFAADLEWVKAQGIAAARYNLAQQPAAFVGNAVVGAALAQDPDCLPLVLVDGQIVSRGDYPTREALAFALCAAMQARGDRPTETAPEVARLAFRHGYGGPLSPPAAASCSAGGAARPAAPKHCC